jgi:hypothetical protein
MLERFASVLFTLSANIVWLVVHVAHSCAPPTHVVLWAYMAIAPGGCFSSLTVALSLTIASALSWFDQFNSIPTLNLNVRMQTSTENNIRLRHHLRFHIQYRKSTISLHTRPPASAFTIVVKFSIASDSSSTVSYQKAMALDFTQLHDILQLHPLTTFAFDSVLISTNHRVIIRPLSTLSASASEWPQSQLPDFLSFSSHFQHSL